MSTRRAIGIYRSSSGPAPAQDYYLRTVLPDNQAYFPRADGCASIFFSVDSGLYKAKGWGGEGGVFSPWVSSNEVQRSYDEGLTWEDIASMPVHSHGFSFMEKEGELWACGMGENMDGSSAGVFLIKYDHINDSWITITLDAGLDLCEGCIYIVYNNNFYKFGGQDSLSTPTPTAINTIYRINDNGTTTFIGNTPESFMSASTWYVIGSSVYVGWGGEVNQTIPFRYNSLCTKIYKSTTGLSSWTFFADIPAGQQGIWCDAQYFDGKVWQLNGYFEGANRTGLFNSTTSGASWNAFGQTPTARHLTSMPVSDDFMYLICGNDKSDVLRIEKVTLPESFANNDIKTWWLGLYPAYRPTKPELDDINILAQELMDAPTPSTLSDHWSMLDLFNPVAGFENINQFKSHLKTTNTTFDNKVTMINTGASWTYYGAKGSGHTSGSSSGSLWDMKWVADVDGVNHTVNSAFLACFSFDDIKEDIWDVGNVEASVGGGVAVKQTNDVFYIKLNDASDVNVASPASAKGFRAAWRTSNTIRKAVYDTTTVNVNQASTDVGHRTDKICGYSEGGLFYTGLKNTGGYIRAGGDIDPQVYRTALINFYTRVATRTGNPIL